MFRYPYSLQRSHLFDLFSNNKSQVLPLELVTKAACQCLRKTILETQVNLKKPSMSTARARKYMETKFARSVLIHTTRNSQSRVLDNIQCHRIFVFNRSTYIRALGTYLIYRQLSTGNLSNRPLRLIGFLSSTRNPSKL